MNYKTTRWKRKRMYILNRDLYECQESKRFGKTMQANTVHHIYPVDLFPELAWTDWNLISLTQSQHNKMHDRDTNEITALGKQWQRKFKRQFEREMKEYAE